MSRRASQFGSVEHMYWKRKDGPVDASLKKHRSKMQSDKGGFPKLFYSSIIDAKDDVEEKFDKARAVLQRLTGGGSEREAHDALQNAVCRDKSTHDDIALGLLANMLTDSGSSQKAFRDLTFISRDMAVVVENMMLVTSDKYHKLTDVSRSQLIWVVKEFVRAGITGADALCWNLVRQVAGGDVSNRNLWLAENLLEMFVENRVWLDKHPVLVGSVIFTYLRIIEDHFPPNLANLRQKEVNFVVTLIRENFAHVMNPNLGMGRDFVRLLQGVSRIPEIQAVWVDLIQNPQTLSPHFTGVLQLLNIRTSRKFLQCRLTPEMEKKIVFLTTYVKFGMHKRYQDWFQKQFLATPESQTLRADIIRFIVGVIHPPNEILCSDILPRWAVIGWLFTTCTSPVAAATAKLALFFDWLTFDAIRDNIMNIEPGILVMFHSIRPHIGITTGLIDFLIRQISEFWPDKADKIKEGIGSAFRTILDKKVLPSLEPLLENSKLEPELRNSIQGVLMPLIRKDFDAQGNNGHSADSAEIRPEEIDIEPLPNSTNNCGEVNHVPVKMEPASPAFPITVVNLEPEFSDSDEDVDDKREYDSKPPPAPPITGTKSPPSLDTSAEEAEKSKMFDLVQALQPNLRLPLETILGNPDKEKAESLQEVIEELSSIHLDKSQRDALVKVLAYIFKKDLTSPCVDSEETGIQDAASPSPIHDLMLLLLQTKSPDKASKAKIFLRIIADMINIVPQIAYKVLFTLFTIYESGDVKQVKEDYYPSVYKTLCSTRGLKIEQAIQQDLKTCWEIEPITVGFLCPIIYDWYPQECIGSAEILRLVVSTIDSSQLQDIVWKIAQGEFVMIDTPDMLSIISKTLEWETWEQHCVWTILAAHSFEIDDYLPVIPLLDYKNNAEALTALFLKLKNEKPSDKILGPCLCRKPNPRDSFVLSLLMCWSEDKEDRDNLAEVLTSILVKAYGSPTKRKRGHATGRGGTASPAGPATPNVDYVLSHLDFLRQHIGDGGVFTTDTMQAALLQVQSWVTDSQRSKYSQLLELAAIEESSEIKESRSVVKRNTSGRTKLPASPTGGGTGGGGGSGNSGTNTGSNTSISRTRSGRPTRQAMKDDPSDSSSNDEDEEIIPRSRNAKKRRKTSALNSDSD